MIGCLAGVRIAALVDNGFEQIELTAPKEAFEAEGATVEVVSPQRDKVKGWERTDWGEEIPVDVPIDEARADAYDALFLPGGVMSPDHLRINARAVAFVRAFVTARKPIAAICHGPWTLIDAEGVRGRRITSWPSLQRDLRNAGGVWVDEPVIVDRGLVTSRKPDDIPAFTAAAITAFSESHVNGPEEPARAR